MQLDQKVKQKAFRLGKFAENVILYIENPKDSTKTYLN